MSTIQKVFHSTYYIVENPPCMWSYDMRHASRKEVVRGPGIRKEKPSEETSTYVRLKSMITTWHAQIIY
jgi:hypothetical protein